MSYWTTSWCRNESFEGRDECILHVVGMWIDVAKMWIIVGRVFLRWLQQYLLSLIISYCVVLALSYQAMEANFFPLKYAL